MDSVGEVMFVLPKIGTLVLEHIFYYWDYEPILFVCKNEEGKRYLCSCCELSKQWAITLVAGLGTLIQLMRNSITIRDAFWYKPNVRLVTWDGEKFNVSRNAPPELLPKKGEYLDLKHENKGAYYNQILTEQILDRGYTMDDVRCFQEHGYLREKKKDV